MRRLRRHHPERRLVTSSLQTLRKYERRTRLNESLHVVGPVATQPCWTEGSDQRVGFGRRDRELADPFRPSGFRMVSASSVYFLTRASAESLLRDGWGWGWAFRRRSLILRAIVGRELYSDYAATSARRTYLSAGRGGFRVEPISPAP